MARLEIDRCWTMESFRTSSVTLGLLPDFIRSALGMSSGPGTAPLRLKDSLTGAYQREQYERDAKAAIDKARSAVQSLSMVVIDVDKFKQVNDTYGHRTGDEVLRSIGSCLLSAFNGKGDVYRYGGDEFVVLLPNYEIDEAVTVAERVRREVAKIEVGEVAVTCSLGVAVFGKHVTNEVDLFESADKALYKAKAGNRNKVAAADSPG